MVLSEILMKDSMRRRMNTVRFGAIVFSGILSSAALPGNGLPWYAAWFALVPFLLALKGTGKFTAPLYGWLWGTIYGWGGFYWLHEIHPAAGVLIGPVFGAFWMVFSTLTAFFWKYIYTAAAERAGGSSSIPISPAWYKTVFFIAAVASLFVFTEFLRWHILPWNAFGVTQWQVPLVRGLAAQTGIAGISFVLAAFNTAIAVEIYGYCRLGRQYKPAAGFLSAVFLLIVTVSGSLPVLLAEKPQTSAKTAVGIVQPDLPRRKLDLTEAEWRKYNLDSIDFNCEATSAILQHSAPQIILWPETSVSTPFRSGSAMGEHYRAKVAGLLTEYPDIELLIGSIDWQEQLPGATEPPGLTNSALLIGIEQATGTMEMRGRYDKQHLVPFGEYVPFRPLLPEWLIRQISMGDDLAPGGINTPLRCNGINIGVNICFEDIFDYISREFAQNGANLLVVITNDSWYPGYAEQYQHLANSIFRSLETGLPMIRCGSNSGSAVIHPDGHLESLPGLDPFEHVSAAGVFHITPGPYPGIRLFRMFGNWLQFICLLTVAAAAAAAARIWIKESKNIINTPTTGKEEIGS